MEWKCLFESRENDIRVLISTAVSAVHTGNRYREHLIEAPSVLYQASGRIAYSYEASQLSQDQDTWDLLCTTLHGESCRSSSLLPFFSACIVPQRLNPHSHLNNTIVRRTNGLRLGTEESKSPS